MGAHGHIEKTKWHSIHEIPDELVKTYSKRDPNNPLYRTRRWVNYKKTQLLFQQNDGVPTYLRTPIMRFVYRATWAGTWACLALNIYTYNKFATKK